MQPEPAGDAAAFAEAIAPYRRLIARIAASYARSEPDRLDLAQDILLQLWRAWPRFDPTRPLCQGSCRLIILARVVLGIDLYAQAPAWLWLSMLIGVGGLVGSLALARYLAQRAVASPALSRWIDLLAGRSLARAAREIDDLTAYADEA